MTWSCRWAGPDDDEQLTRLAALPMPGAMVLSSRCPQGYQRSLQGETAHSLIVEDEHGRILGFGSRLRQSLLVAGQPTPIDYLAGLRCPPGRMIPRQAFAAAYAHLLADSDALCLSAILDDNYRARRLLEARLPHLPPYEPRCALETRIWSPRRRLPRAHGIQVVIDPPQALRNELQARAARDYDLLPVSAPPQARCFLALRDGRPRACVHCWDRHEQQHFVVVAYHGLLRWLRPAWNCWALLTQRPPLPRPGSVSEGFWCSHVWLDGVDHACLDRLLAAIHEHARRCGKRFLYCGQASHHPLIAHLRRRCPGLAIPSTLYSIGETEWTIDRARCAPEVACL